MANLPNHGSKSEQKMNKHGATFLENAVSKIQERRCDLSHRQQYLKEKISAMERSIPALMAFNMWTSRSKSDEPPLGKIRQIMGKLSPNHDPTDKLVDNLKNTVKSLNMETAELHDKIINADIKLEESQMELESIEMENKEIDESLKCLEEELTTPRVERTPSLHSIHSDDIFCLAKIRQLGEEEINLKNSIRELEERETIFQEQINRILTSREFQKSVCNDRTCERKSNPCNMKPRIKDSQEMKKKYAAKGKHPPKSPEEKPAPKRPEMATGGASGTKNVGILEPAMKASATARGENVGNHKNPKSRGCPVTGKTSIFPSRAKAWPSSCCHDLSSSTKSFGKSSSLSGSIKCCKDKTCCQILPKFSAGTICKKCLGRIVAKERPSPPSFKGKCAGAAASGAACDCTDDYDAATNATLKSRRHPTRSDDQSTTDEEYSDCCDCGCNDSDFSSTESF